MLSINSRLYGSTLFGVVAGFVCGYFFRYKFIWNSRVINVNNLRKKIISNPDECIVEISLGDVYSALQASNGGANSLELCCNINDGGVSPSIGLVERCVCLLSEHITISVLIRPRPGDFIYDRDEFNVILKDIAAVKMAGSHGVVVGVLTSSRQIDVVRMNIIRKAATGMILTFHRAFDTVSDPFSALEDIISVGCDRLLTSGQAASALEGTSMLSRLHVQSAGRIKIIAAAGINVSNVEDIIRATGVDGVHAATSVTKNRRTQFHVNDIKSDGVSTLPSSTVRMGTAGSSIDDTSQWVCVDTDRVRRFRDQAILGWFRRSA